jgi:transcriptional regulator with GAF, ATPase, and Fis domain
MGQGGEPETREDGRSGRSRYALDELAPRGYGPYADAHGLVGWSRPLLALGTRIDALGPSPAPVFVEGETGTGKELIARALHRRSLRADRPFLPHNFAAIPDSLVESELFGHVKGAFTGAHADRPGLFELAHGGTLFLDEIGDASHSVQTRLLRVLQEGEVRRVGDGRARRVDVRVVAATHRDLRAEVRCGRFRADLFYRLHVLTVRAPALRERREDIPLLAAHALRRLHRLGRPEARSITAEAIEVLSGHAWPGNVRELEAALERAAHGLAPGGLVTTESLGEGLLPVPGSLARERVDEDLRGRTRALEAELIRRAIDRAGGNKAAAARALGLTRQGLWKKIRRLADEGRAGSSATACADPESV